MCELTSQPESLLVEVPERTVFVLHSPGVVGVERSTVALVKAARAQGAQVTVFLPKAGPILDLLQGIEGVEVRYLKAQWWMGWDHTGVRGFLKAVQALLQTVRWWPAIARTRPTTVYVMSTVIPAPMLAARLARVPLVTFLSESIRRNPEIKSAIPKSSIIKVVKTVSTVTVARSKFAAEQYGGASVIEPPDIGSPQRAGIHRTRRSENLRRLVMLGSLSDEKGQQDAVRAVCAARAKGVPLTLDLYGSAEPKELEMLNVLIDSLGSADFVCHRGVTMEPLRIFASADMSLVCSRNEAYGRVTVESLSVGTPVLGYRAGGTAEILEDGGGIAVDPSVEALTDALATLGTDDRMFQDLVQAAATRQQTRQGFGDGDRTIRKIRDALTKSATQDLQP